MVWSFLKKQFQKINPEDKPSTYLREMVSIRMEAIGGQGANSAGKIYAEAAVIGMGYTGNHFSSFGSEKRGTPVKSYVRFSPHKRPIRSASQIKNPDILVVFHNTLMKSHPQILSGLSETSMILVNSSDSPDQIPLPAEIRFATIYTVDAQKIATKRNCGLNAPILGVLSQIVPEVQSNAVLKAMENFFASKAEKIIESNRLGFEDGAKSFKSAASRDLMFEEKLKVANIAQLPEMGWLNSPIGGAILNPGNSILKNHTASRKGIAPRFYPEICFHCGFCDMVCPDYCFVWEIDPSKQRAPRLNGIDYQYCKGCQKCVTVCPVNALQAVDEQTIPPQEKQLSLFPEAQSLSHVESWKSLDWVHYVESLSDSEKMLTPQNELLDPDSYLCPYISEQLRDSINKKRNDEK